MGRRSAFELLALWAWAPRRASDRAVADLYALVRALTARVGVRAQMRDDVASDVMTAIWRRGPGAIVDALVARSPRLASVRDAVLGLDLSADASDEKVAGRIALSYVAHAVSNRWISICRGARVRVIEFDDEVMPAPAPTEPEEAYERAIEVVEMAVERVAERRPDARETYDELRALVSGATTMDACVAREMGRAGAKSAKTARDRLQQRHKRLRAALSTEIKVLAKQGVVAPDQALGHRFVEQVLNRAPKRAPGPRSVWRRRSGRAVVLEPRPKRSRTGPA